MKFFFSILSKDIPAWLLGVGGGKISYKRKSGGLKRPLKSFKAISPSEYTLILQNMKEGTIYKS